jgi:hypothetical protein
MVTSKKLKVKNKTIQAENIQDGVNITPKVSIISPVGNKGLKAIWDELSRFVSVGGDFV